MIEIIAQVLSNLRANKLRSFLTMFGILWGVISVVILSATGGAADSDSRRAALGAVLLIAWLAGLAIAVARRARMLGAPSSPVS